MTLETNEWTGAISATTLGTSAAATLAEKIKAAPFEVGYNAAKDECVDMYEAGIIDPTKVARVAVQNAASIAGMILTTEAAITEIPEDEKMPPMPPGGDMGGMGGMGGMM